MDIFYNTKSHVLTSHVITFKDFNMLPYSYTLQSLCADHDVDDG